METAYTPGDGGCEPSIALQSPGHGKLAEWWPAGGVVGGGGGGGGGSWIAASAPPAVRSASVALPACTLLTSPGLFTGSISQTLSSYLSMQASPTRTESWGHWTLAMLNAWTGVAHQQSAAKPTANVTCLIGVPPWL